MKTHQTLLPIQENTTGVVIYDPYLQRNLTGTHVNVSYWIQNTQKRILLNLLYSIISKGTCQRFNGGCEGICVPQQEGCRCECDVGLQLQNDSRTCNSSKSTFTLWKNKTKSEVWYTNPNYSLI